METMIEVKDVSMRFRMANDRINSIKEYAIARLRGKLQYNEFEALKHVSFDVKKGEVVGLIGHNGDDILSGYAVPLGSCKSYVDVFNACFLSRKHYPSEAPDAVSHESDVPVHHLCAHLHH